MSLQDSPFGKCYEVLDDFSRSFSGETNFGSRQDGARRLGVITRCTFEPYTGSKLGIISFRLLTSMIYRNHLNLWRYSRIETTDPVASVVSHNDKEYQVGGSLVLSREERLVGWLLLKPVDPENIDTEEASRLGTTLALALGIRAAELYGLDDEYPYKYAVSSVLNQAVRYTPSLALAEHMRYIPPQIAQTVLP